MNNNLNEQMQDAWRAWHGEGVPDYTVPATQPCFNAGFMAAHDLLMPLLIEAMPHVMGSHGAGHMLDGFRPRRHPIDDLVERLKEVVAK